jgi:hypothetical protein
LLPKTNNSAAQNYEFSCPNLRQPIKINKEKSQAMYFTRPRKKELPNKSIKIAGVEIEWSKEIKYLGLILDKSLTFRSHVEFAVERMQKCIRILYPLLSRKSKLNTTNKILLYKQILRPMLVYGSAAFKNMAKTHYAKLQVAQNKAIKLALNFPWRTSTKQIHTTSKLETIAEFTNKIYKRFIERLQQN